MPASWRVQMRLSKASPISTTQKSNRVKVAKSYQIKEKRYTNEEIQKKLSENFKQFSKELKEKGIQIQGNSVKIHIGKKSAVAKGSLYLNEDIAKKADTEILEIERNKKDESFRTDD